MVSFPPLRGRPLPIWRASPWCATDRQPSHCPKQLEPRPHAFSAGSEPADPRTCVCWRAPQACDWRTGSPTAGSRLAESFREEVHPGAALFRTVGRGLAWPGSGPNDAARNDVPYVITTVEQARQAVRDLAPHRPDFVKIWVDDRNHTQKKLTPELYGAAIDEAHKYNLRTIAHVFDLEDAKGLLRAGIEGFTHLVRDKEIDDEFLQ